MGMAGILFGILFLSLFIGVPIAISLGVAASLTMMLTNNQNVYTAGQLYTDGCTVLHPGW